MVVGREKRAVWGGEIRWIRVEFTVTEKIGAVDWLDGGEWTVSE